MSRCYPYLRRTGYSNGNRNGGSDGPLMTESFKLQSKNEKPKTEQGPVSEQVKESRRDKEKRKVRKQKEEKLNDFSDGKVKSIKNDKSYREKKFKDGFSDSCLQKGSKEEKVESLETSGLTEEHDEPTYTCLSDGTHSSKRKRDSMLASTSSSQSSNKKMDSTPSSGITVHRNILRIRLPSQKQREYEALPRKEQSHSTAKKVADSCDQQRETLNGCGKEHQRCGTYYINGQLPLPLISDSVRKDNVDDLCGAKTSIGATSCESEMRRTEAVYQALMDGLASTPLVLQAETNIIDDEEWLFGTKQQRQASKKLKAGEDDVSRGQSSTMWPKAQFLQEAGIYALPYTIPF